MKIGAMMLPVSVRKPSPTATAVRIVIHKVIRIRFGPSSASSIRPPSSGMTGTRLKTAHTMLIHVRLAVK